MADDWKQDLNKFFDEQETKEQQQTASVQQQNIVAADFFQTKVSQPLKKSNLFWRLVVEKSA